MSSISSSTPVVIKKNVYYTGGPLDNRGPVSLKKGAVQQIVLKKLFLTTHVKKHVHNGGKYSLVI